MLIRLKGSGQAEKAVKKPEHVKRAKDIGNDSWELQHFTMLRTNASARSQVEALRRDAEWLTAHMEEIGSAIMCLMQGIEVKS